MNGTLSFYKCSLSGRTLKSGEDTQKWWGHSNPTCCNQICLNRLHSEVVNTLNQLLHDAHALVLLAPNEPPCKTFTT